MKGDDAIRLCLRQKKKRRLPDATKEDTKERRQWDHARLISCHYFRVSLLGVRSKTLSTNAERNASKQKNKRGEGELQNM